MENPQPIHPVSYHGGISGFYACRAASLSAVLYFASNSHGRPLTQIVHQITSIPKRIPLLAFWRLKRPKNTIIN